jgi:hypothetical protein
VAEQVLVAVFLMPGNEVEDRIHNLYELQNSSQGQHQSQAVDSNWPVLNYNQWVGKQRQTGEALSSNLINCNVQQLGICDFHYLRYSHNFHGSFFITLFLKTVAILCVCGGVDFFFLSF